MKQEEVQRMQELQNEISELEKSLEWKYSFLPSLHEVDRRTEKKNKVDLLKKELSPLEFQYNWMEQDVMRRVNEETKQIEEIEKREEERKEYERLKTVRKPKTRAETITLSDILKG